MNIHTYIEPTLGGQRIGVRLGPFISPVAIDGFVIQASGGLTVAQPREELNQEGDPLPPEEGFRFLIGDPALIDLQGADPDWAFTLYDGFKAEAVAVESSE